MYALIILRHRKPPELLTIFKDRNEFIAAVGQRKSPEPWRAATKAFRAVYEVHDDARIRQFAGIDPRRASRCSTMPATYCCGSFRFPTASRPEADTYISAG